MVKILNPEKDLLFKTNSKVQISTSTNGSHLLSNKGNEVSDPGIKKPYTNRGMHVCGCNKKIEEKME